MSDKHINLCDLAAFMISARHTCVERDLGDDAHLAKLGFSFSTRAWDIEGIGNLCTIQMVFMRGLMRMETAVIAPTCVDLPLANLDYVYVAGNETQVIEFYDTQIEPLPDAMTSEMSLIMQRDSDIPSTESDEAHWYDEILLPCSYHKKTRGQTERLSDAVADYLVSYTDQLAQTPQCDKGQKEAKVRAFAERLFSEGGPAVEMMTGLFGPQTARRLVVEHMYGVRG